MPNPSVILYYPMILIFSITQKSVCLGTAVLVMHKLTVYKWSVFVSPSFIYKRFTRRKLSLWETQVVLVRLALSLENLPLEMSSQLAWSCCTETPSSQISKMPVFRLVWIKTRACLPLSVHGLSKHCRQMQGVFWRRIRVLVSLWSG